MRFEDTTHNINIYNQGWNDCKAEMKADLEKAQLNEAYAMHDRLCAQAELAEAYEYAKLNGVAASELNLELGKLREKLDWYFECEEVRHWFFVRTDVDCTDYHKDDEHCPWCTPNGEIEMSYQQAKADLWRE